MKAMFASDWQAPIDQSDDEFHYITLSEPCCVMIETTIEDSSICCCGVLAKQNTLSAVTKNSKDYDNLEESEYRK